MMKDRGFRRSASLWVCPIILLLLPGCADSNNSVPDETGAPNGAAEPAPGAAQPDVDSPNGATAGPVTETANGGETATPADAETTGPPPGTSRAAESPATEAIASGAPEATAAATDAAADAKTFSASGVVMYDGPPPERSVIDMKRDEKCVELHGAEQVLGEDLLVNNAGGMKNVFVYVRGGVPKKDYPIPEEVGVLDQKGCMYVPRVQGVRAGQAFQFVNSDPLLHNIRGFPVRNRPFNVGQKPGSEPRDRVFERPERPIEVQCDVHTWMRGYIFVMDHPFFAVTAEDGTFSIQGLPPGEYTLAAWQEKYRRELRQKMTVVVDDIVDLKFTFEPLDE